MPETYNPTATDQASFTLPNDGEAATADSVKVPFRQLADKCKWLDDEKLRDVVMLDAVISIIGTENKPEDHPGSPLNTWKQIISARTNDDTYVRFFTGAGNAAAWAITWNGAWHPDSGDQHWTRDNNALNSAILWNDSTTLRYETKAAGSSPWTDWDGPASEFEVTGNLTATGDLSVGDDATITGDLVAGTLAVSGTSTLQAASVTNITMSGQLTYGSPPSRTVSVNAFSGFGGGDVASEGERMSLAIAASQVIPIKVPHGALLGAMRFRLGGVGGIAQYTCKLKRRHSIDFGAAAGTNGYTYADVDSATGTAQAPPFETETGLSWGGLTADSAEEYQVWIQCDGASPNALLIAAIDLTYTEPGFRHPPA